MSTILFIFGLIICLSAIIRLLLLIGVFFGLHGANKLTARGEQIDVNKRNLVSAKAGLVKNAIILIIGLALVFVGKTWNF